MPDEKKSPGGWLDRRLIFVMGKGGVGKTTLSIAMALAAEAAGKQVLLAEAEESCSVSRFFGEPDLCEAPVYVSRGIRIARIDPKAELEAYTHFHVKSGFVARRITRSRLFDYLSEATPGLKEIMTLGRIWRWETARHKKTDRPIYDMIIIDSPATGHALSLLRLPRMLIDMIRVGPIVSQVQGLLRLLKDEERTWLTLACLPEELPVKESIELMAVARDEIDIPVRLLLLNGVYPPLFTAEQAGLLESLLSGNQSGSRKISDPEGFEKMLTGARHQFIRRRIHKGYVDQLRNQTSVPVIEIPFYFTNNLTLREIRQLSSDCLDPDKKKVVHAGGNR